jgi:hypothetical protein
MIILIFTAKRGRIADFVKVGSLVDPVGALSVIEIAPYFVKIVPKLFVVVDIISV